MYLKALQRARRVPMRCSNEGFFTTTNAVASLHVNLIIFSFCVCLLFSVSLLLRFSCFLSHYFLLLTFFLFWPLISFSPFSASPLRFPTIDPIFFQMGWDIRILFLSCSMLPFWNLSHFSFWFCSFNLYVWFITIKRNYPLLLPVFHKAAEVLLSSNWWSRFNFCLCHLKCCHNCQSAHGDVHVVEHFSISQYFLLSLRVGKHVLACHPSIQSAVVEGGVGGVSIF